ncbi:MAG: LysM peptidoglycan-binding domain-containing protein [Opitutales bacterium]|nr:LysM peptidoglycan-binding domain-containing protein [Opitutales bacterium]
MENSSFDADEIPNNNSHLGLYIALAAFAIGAIGVGLGLVARNQSQTNSLRIENLVSEVNKTVDARLAGANTGANDEELIRALESKIETLEKESRTTIATLKTKCEALEKAIQAMNANRNTGTRPNNNTQTANNNTGTRDNNTTDVSPTTPGDTTEYIVQAGDNFTKIARTNNCKVTEIENLNPGVDPRKIRPGQKLIVPAK